MKKGIYTLVLYLPTSLSLKVGSLGTINLCRGYYCYTGSAHGGIGRVFRHIMKIGHIGYCTRHYVGHYTSAKWHIDYLLPLTKFSSVVISYLPREYECVIARRLGHTL